jgi:hypothetical protein
MVVVDSSVRDSTASTKQLATKYGVDVELLEKLVRSVNVPSEREGDVPLDGAGAGDGAGSVRRYVRDAESGEDIVVREVSSFSFCMS